MVSGIKQAVQGMTIQMHKQDQIANNLANINTTGFKKSSLFASSIDEYLKNDKGEVRANREIRSDEVFSDFSEGTIKRTDSPLDLAIRGDGFFTTMSNEGMRYTRDGNFTLDKNGFVVTTTGDRLMGEGGFIRADTNGGKLSFLENGSVMQDGNEVGILRMADFEKPYRLNRMGNNNFRPKLPNNPVLESTGFSISQGYLETSNVNPIEEMTAMISAHRSYEAISKALKSQDETLGKAVNEVGRLK